MRTGWWVGILGEVELTWVQAWVAGHCHGAGDDARRAGAGAGPGCRTHLHKHLALLQGETLIRHAHKQGAIRHWDAGLHSKLPHLRRAKTLTQYVPSVGANSHLKPKLSDFWSVSKEGKNWYTCIQARRQSTADTMGEAVRYL